MKSKNALGVFILIGAAVIWGMSFAFQRSGMDYIGPFTFQATRNILAIAAIAVVLLVTHKKDAFKFSKETLIAGLCCGILLFLAANVQQIGIMDTTAGKAGFITAMYIIIVPIVSSIFLKRKPELKIWVAVVIAAVGLYLLCVKEDFTITKGDLWVLLCAFLFSGHILVTDHFVSKVDPIQMSLLQFIVATALSWVFALTLETPQWSAIWDARVAIIYCGVFSGGVGYTLQILGQKYAEPTSASLAMSLESVFAAIGGWLILNEVMSGKELLGAVLMFAAIILVQIKIKK